jgi:hypothetical protein
MYCVLEILQMEFHPEFFSIGILFSSTQMSMTPRPLSLKISEITPL